MRDYINLIERAQNPVINSPAFQNWFKGSKVVDKHGQPLVCYHGTYEDFSKFSYQSENVISYGFNRLGFWFDVDPRTPAYFAGYDENHSNQSMGSVYPCYLNIKKPFFLDSEYLFGEDQQKIRELSKNFQEYSKLFHSGTRDRLGNMVLPNGKFFDERLYRNAKKELDDFQEKLGGSANRIDGFWRMIDLLPNGFQSTTKEVVNFQKELIAEGHDGIYLGDTIADFATRNFDTTHWWIAFHPNQIKSVFAKEFNADSDDISEDFPD